MLGGVGASRFCSNPAARVAYVPSAYKISTGFLLLQLKSNHYKNVMGLEVAKPWKMGIIFGQIF